MILEETLLKIGRIFKPHGFKGELTIDLEYDLPGSDLARLPLFIRIDGIFVPFFPVSLRGGVSGNSFVRFKGIDSDIDALKLSNHDLYMLKADFSVISGVGEEELDAFVSGYAGFLVVDQNTNEPLGYVEDIEEGVEYDYLTVKTAGGKVLDIPFIDEFVSEISEDSADDAPGVIIVNLPEGFLDL